MKISQFVIPFTAEGRYYIFNTKDISVFSVTEQAYNLLNLAQQCEDNISNIPKDLVKLFAERQIIIDSSSEDTSFCHKMEYLRRMKSFSSKTLSLVIAPTLACNFACPYCYESNLPTRVMTDETQDNIIRFINSYSQKCNQLELCWEGGEPLLAFNRVRQLIGKIIAESVIPINYQSVITNGYLLTEDICEYFNSVNINFVQITIDGNKDTHNKTRILKNGEGTFERILSNVDMLAKMAPNCKILIRTNVHQNNKEEFGILYKELKKRWEKYHNVVISPTFVIDNANCKVACCSAREKTDFYLKLKHDYGIDNINFMPKHKLGHCSAMVENSFIIDPSGKLYKCWNEIGLENRSIGSICDGITNNELIAEYIVGSDKYHDPKCLACSLFPICDGGCNRMRLESFDGASDNVLCPFTKEGIIDCIKEHLSNLHCP